MKKIIWFVFLGMIMIVQPVCAQNKVTEQQKKEYEKGNRDRNFLKEYIVALMADGQTEMLNGAVDEYLMVLPLNERYTGENLADFMEYIIRVDARAFIDVIENWDKISLNREQADKVVEKIDNVCKMDLFNAVVKKGEEGVKDYGVVQAVLQKSGIPISNTRRQMINMWQCWRVNNLAGMILALEKMVVKLDPIQKCGNGVTSLDLDTVFEGVVIGNMLNYMLEECDEEQCNQILEMLDQAIVKNGRDGFMEMFTKMRDNFEGKKMMMEMGEE